MSKLIYLTDRSRIETREECERKRYLNYDFPIDGEMLGLQRKENSLPLLNGDLIHEAHAKLLAHAAGIGGADIDTVVHEMRTRYASELKERPIYGSDVDPEHLLREQSALLEGLLRSFERLWIPRILEEFEIISIEYPMDWELAPGLVQKLRFDVVMRRKGDGQLVILDYKSIAYISDAWAKKVENSRQTHLYIAAAQELFGESVEMAYLALIKGTWRKDTAKSSPFYEQKIQSSPLLYAYALYGDVGNVYQTAYTNKKGYVKIRTYESIPGGMKEWVDWLWHNERNTVNELFVWNPPVRPLARELTRVRELVVREELKYLENIRTYEKMKLEAELKDDDYLRQQAEDFLDFVAAPRRDNVCFKYGDPCPFYYGICHNEGGLENVLEDGEFEPRIPHHSTELETI